MQELHLGDEIEPLLDYFDLKTSTSAAYAGQPDVLHDMPAHQLWNMHVRVEDELPKTNKRIFSIKRRVFHVTFENV